MSYQGYKNYETWAVCLWIDNEEDLYNHWKYEAEELLSTFRSREIPDCNPDPDLWKEVKNQAIDALAKKLKDEFEESMPEVEGLWSDLLTAAMGSVDWWEVAQTRYDE